ncbi:MAG: hypothetical protein Q9170_004254 [Blastenia crenularia]
MFEEDWVGARLGLLRAYGKRASEISQKSLSADQGSGKNGVFASFLGADITSVWAAATSGASSIAVHLLACLLARLWSGPEATSIWVEIVAERKRIIQERANDGTYNTSIELTIIASQDITRNDLAQWDASARAWLQVGDDAFMRQQKQLMLIVNNVHLPVTTGKTTFDRVIDAWVTAMNAMEKLIRGEPQRAANGAALMGLASWHLYPDLLVLGEAISSVTFHDTAIPDSAQLTVGLENLDTEDHDGIHWSLSLSHLRFYGDPVVAKTYTSRDASRLKVDELQLLALGATLAEWGDIAFDTHAGARFFQALGGACLDDAVDDPNLTWLKGLCRASETFLDSSGDDKNNALAIIGLGRRKGRQFLADKQNYPPPLLGINHPFIDALLSDPTEECLTHRDLHMLHFIASHLGLKPDQLIIRIKRFAGQDEVSGTTYHYFEYKTAIPHFQCVYQGMGESHIRWIETHDEKPDAEVDLANSHTSPGCKCHSRSHHCHKSICVCMQKGITCTPYCHKIVEPDSASISECLGCRRKDVAPIGPSAPRRFALQALQCENMPKSEITFRPEKGLFHDFPLEVSRGLPDWNIGITRTTSDFPTAPRLAIRHNPARGPLCTCFQTAPTFTLLAGDANGVAMFIRVDSGVRRSRTILLQNLAEAAKIPPIPLDTVIKCISSSKFKSGVLRKYLQNHEYSLPSFSHHLHPKTTHVTPFINSLNALALATAMYQDFPGATAFLGVIQHSLHKARWVPRDEAFWAERHRSLMRQQRFACIAFFESGSYDLRPSDLTEVMAMSLRISIYVSFTLLGDPYEFSQKDRVALVVGNVGKPGIVMMVAPLAPRVKPADVNAWRQITHAPFQGAAEDCFRATSLHLSFTDFEMPFAVGQRGAIDNDIAMVETVISIHDRGKWVGDIDALSLYEESLSRNRFLQRFNGFRHDVDGERICTHRKDYDPPQRLTALDSWEEILDLPEDLRKQHFGVVRAQKNWLARLSAACIATQMEVRTVILPNEPQWKWRAAKRDDSVLPQSRPPRQTESSILRGLTTEHLSSLDYMSMLNRDLMDESGYASDDSVRTVELYGSVKDELDTVPQLFIY